MILKTKEFNEIVDHIQNLAIVYLPNKLKRVCDDMDLDDVNEEQIHNLQIKSRPDGYLGDNTNQKKYIKARISNTKNIKL